MLSGQPKGWRGYVSSRALNGNMVPQRVQNLVIRNYAARHQLLYLLSATEYSMGGCTMVLRSVLQNLTELAGLIFYSTHQLPPSRSSRELLFSQILSAGCGLHFALEEIVVECDADVLLLQDIFMVRDLAVKDADELPVLLF